MKTSKLRVIIPTVATLAFMSATPATAFWPFDMFNNNVNSAQSESSTSTLVNKIIQKFNLNQDEVEQVVTDYRSERRQQMQTQYEERLNQAVTDGKITPDQKQMILNKRNELQSQWDAETQQRQQHRQEMQEWADQNGIDLEFLMMGQGRGARGGMMKGEGMGMVRGQGR